MTALQDKLMSNLVIKDSYSTIADENYMVVRAHIDSVFQGKIINHEYIDFVKLLP